MSVSCECCALSVRGVFVGLITHSEDSYWVWCILTKWSWSLGIVEALVHWGLSGHWGGGNKNLLCEHGTNHWIAQRLGIWL